MKFEFDIEQVNVILSGLGELPAKVSMDLITSIHKQAEKQMQPEMVSEEGLNSPFFIGGQTVTVANSNNAWISCIYTVSPGTQI